MGVTGSHPLSNLFDTIHVYYPPYVGKPFYIQKVQDLYRRILPFSVLWVQHGLYRPPHGHHGPSHRPPRGYKMDPTVHSGIGNISGCRSLRTHTPPSETEGSLSPCESFVCPGPSPCTSHGTGRSHPTLRSPCLSSLDDYGRKVGKGSNRFSVETISTSLSRTHFDLPSGVSVFLSPRSGPQSLTGSAGHMSPTLTLGSPGVP